ncbi:MAG TPA: (d)CMP kinase [Microbacterium sp.]|nr:(d)CMP kinase [Microbacterium sp.]
MTDPSTGSGTAIIAIDGPAGSGKSSVSKQLARTRGYGYLDTGAAYRALTWRVLQDDADVTDADAVLATASHLGFAISLDPDDYWVAVGGADVTEAIREPRVSAAVSAVARIPEVRTAMNRMFRRYARGSKRTAVVMEGRDITTVVAPDAPVRILLTADEAVRAARRSKEVTTQDAATVAEALRTRDAADSKVVDFLTAADGVVVVDSTDLDFEGTVAAVLAVIDEVLEERDGR